MTDPSAIIYIWIKYQCLFDYALKKQMLQMVCKCSQSRTIYCT